MIVEKKELENLIFESVDEVNKMLPAESHLSKEIKSILVGENGIYDSLSIVNFLVSLEGKLADKYAEEIILIQEETLSNPEGPNRTLESLRDYILDIVLDV